MIRVLTESEETKFRAKVRFPRKESQCWLWIGATTRDGYGAFSIGRILHPSHRVSWVIHHGPIPNGLWVLHKCDVRNCINPSHLFLGTAKDNTHDMLKKGRGVKPPRTSLFGDANPSRIYPTKRPRGEGHVLSKLTDKKVRLIRKSASAYSMEALAKKFGSSRSTVRRILKGEAWTHIS